MAVASATRTLNGAYPAKRGSPMLQKKKVCSAEYRAPCPGVLRPPPPAGARPCRHGEADRRGNNPGPSRNSRRSRAPAQGVD